MIAHLLFSCGLLVAASAAAVPAYTLWYDRPATNWLEALPLGNGRLGAMVYGGARAERLQINEDTIWSGRFSPNYNTNAISHLAEARRLLFEGKVAEANEVCEANLASPTHQGMTYQTLGTVCLDLEDTGESPAEEIPYRRELSLDDAVARVTGAGFAREVIASQPDDVLVVRIVGQKVKCVRWETPMTNAVQRVAANGDVVLAGFTGGHEGVEGGVLKYEGRVRVVAGERETLVFIAAATNYRKYNDLSRDPTAANVTTLDKACAKTWDELKTAHVADYRALADRCTLDLGPDRYPSVPTDRRIAQYSAVGDDSYFAALYFRFGRYLLIACSRPGTQPANLQGLWNEKTHPAWDSKYTININTEMNYRPADPTNLSELSDPLLR